MRLPTPLLLALGALLAFAVPRAATGQTLPATVPATLSDTTTRIHFDIPAQPIHQAIATLRQQTALRIDIDSVSLERTQSTAVTGSYTAAEALRQMLAGTGMTARFVDERTVTVVADAATRAQTLRPVEIVERPRAGYMTPRTRTATKTPTPLRDVPQAVSIVTRDLMRDLSMQGMADVVRYIPGVTMGQGEGNRDQMTIRGNNTTADFFVDGVRDDVQYFRDLYNVERIEALKGANAMMFGRGGGGGVLNRVTKEAEWDRSRELMLQGGSFDNRRASVDIGSGVTDNVAARFNGMAERSGMFRRGVTVERYGVNPTIAIATASRRTRVMLGYELFSDERTADRGIPSLNGRPVDTDISTFFGDPDASWADISSHVGTATVTHDFTDRVQIRNRTQFGGYRKFYQNVYPGAVTGDEVSIGAYNNRTHRQNLFNQTDLTLEARTGPIAHVLLVGAEVGRQQSDNRRLSGWFHDSTRNVSAPLDNPTISVPVTFRAIASDADNRVTGTVGSLYIQDQVTLSEHWQAVGGVRYERFDLLFDENRATLPDTTLRRVDYMLSPRVGLIFKPMEMLSFYGTHSISWLPSSGDQFASLTDVTQGMKPERFANYEAGAKWDATDRLALTTAVYRLDRTNTRAPDPNDPTKSVQTGSQRTSGFEISASGSITPAWEFIGAYANQSARITSRTTAALPGAKIPLVPRTTMSLWNRYQVIPRLGVGVGVVHRSAMFAAIDQAVTLPGYTDVDGAVFLTLGRTLWAQANIENIFDIDYYSTAHSNNNISPGSRRAVRVSVGTRF